MRDINRASYNDANMGSAPHWITALLLLGLQLGRIADAFHPRIDESPPRSISMCAGASVNLTCSSSGIPVPIVRWFKLKHASITDSVEALASGSGSAELVISSFSQSEVGQYICVAINSIGLVLSETTLLHFPNTELSNVSITSAEKVSVEFVWHTVVLECGCNTKAMDLIWHKMIGGISPSATSSFAPILYLPHVIEQDQGQYVCMAVDDNAIYYSVTRVTLTHACQYTVASITPLGEGVPQLRPAITVPPTLHSTKSLGEYTMLKCCTSDPLPDIRWLRIDAPMPSKVAGVNSTRLLIPDLQMTDMGKYVCVAFNLKGVAISQVAQIHPSAGEEGVLASHPTVNKTVYHVLGQTVALACCVSSVRVLEYHWYVDRGEMVERAAGVQSKTLVIAELSFNETGVYVCIAAGLDDAHVYTTRLIVTEVPYVPTDRVPTEPVSTTTPSLPSTSTEHTLPTVGRNAESSSIIVVGFSCGLGLFVLTSLTTFTVAYICCKKGLFSNSTPGYLKIKEVRLWDIITGKHQETLLNQMIQVVRPDNDMIHVEVGNRASLYNDWWQENESLIGLSITSLQRPYDD